MPCPNNKLDSNVTGLRYAEEACFKQLPTLAADGHDPYWIALEPNSYDDLGGQINTVARNPINPSRQRKKGVVVDLEANGGFNQDLTFFNSLGLLQGFMYADIREKKTTDPFNTDIIAAASVTSGTKTIVFAAGGGTGFLANHLIALENFAGALNAGVKTVASATSTDVVTVEALTTEAAPPATARASVVGYRAAAGTLSIAMNGDLVRLVSTAGVDFTTLGLIPGEWVFIGGDTAIMSFDDNGGFARIKSVAAGYLEFDKVDWATPVAEAGGAKTVELYFGSVLKNESDPALIVRRSYQLERTLGEDADGTMSEYLVGAVANELTLNVPQADKVTVDMKFMAADHQARSGAEDVKDGTRLAIVEGDAFNSSSDFARIKLASVSATDASVDPLFAFSTDLTLTINNNVSGNKAIGVLGAFDMTAGTFEVGGSLTAYFADIAGVAAVRNNADITLDAIMVKDNQGILFDIPLLSLGNGRLNVEQDQPVTLPLETNAAESVFGHTLLWVFFPYLPTAAAA
jgi:hypothetical protein